MKKLVIIVFILLTLNLPHSNAQNNKDNFFYVNDTEVPAGFLALSEYVSQTVTLSAYPNQGLVFDSWQFITPTKLFDKQSSWEYLDLGSDLGTEWRDSDFDDSLWKTGTAIFGYNNNNENTRIDFGSNPSIKYITTYFRKHFQVLDPQLGQFMTMGIMADDGVVVYLNGVEVARLNMPDGEIDYTTLAAGNIADETKYYEFTFPCNALLENENVIAVELHQSSLASSDLSFDAYLNLFSDEAFTPSFNTRQNPVTFDVTMDNYIYPTYKAIPVDSSKYFISLSEMMSDNDTSLIDGYGKSSDWIEIYNSSKDSVSLDGFYLSDNLENRNKWAFPDVYIQGKEYMIIYASEKESFQNELHANFKISSSGEPIQLSYQSELLETIPSTALDTDLSLIKVNGIWQVSIEVSPGKRNIGEQNRVQFSRQAGLYQEDFYLKLSGNSNLRTIRYTLDGSTPNQNSLIYADSLHIKDLTLESNGIANIPTSGNWQAPSVDLLKGIVVKAAFFQGNDIVGAVETKTYLINQDFPNKYGFPVVSISMDPDSLLGHDNGILAMGPEALPNYPHYNANFWKGMEKQCYVEFFEDNGELAFEQSLGFKIHGGYSKGYAQKSIRLTARDEFGADRVYHKIFPNRETTEFKSFILRNSGQDINRSFIRDAVAQDVSQTEHLPMQAYRPSIVFINGVYWGIHNIRERLDDHHYSIKHDISRESIDHLEIDGAVVSGDNSDYLAMIGFMESNDLSIQENFNVIAAQMDIENFTDYMTTEIYVNNHDWPHGNIKFWRSSELDNKWRWSLYDLDPGMGGWAGTADANNLVRALSENGNGKGAWATLILRSLMKNENYKNFFISRFLDRLNTAWKEDVVANRVEDYRALITPIISDHVDRWPTAITSVLAWKYGVNPIRTFGEKRPTAQRQHLIDYFELEDTTFLLTIQNSDTTRGKVRLNTLDITTTTFSGIYLQGVPVSIEAVPSPGYRFSHWLETSIDNVSLSVDLYSDSVLTAVFVESNDADYSSISLNEVYNRDSDALEGTVENQEWIEIYNSSTEPINLAGLFLTDNKNLTRWMFPFNENSIVPAEGFLIVYADEDLYHTEYLEANFNALKTDDIVTLTKIIGTDTTILSQLTVPDNALSNGRYPDGSSTITLFNFNTFKATNTFYFDCNGDQKGEAIVDVCGVCAGGNTSIEVNDCLITGLDSEKEVAIQAYPNPVESSLFLNKELQWILYDINGAEILMGFSDSVDMYNISNGVYFLNTEYGRLKVIKF